ncbi:MAG: ribosome small subunit-dependent GTPase A [Candidatus Krumholzibacteriia bacterium]
MKERADPRGEPAQELREGVVMRATAGSLLVRSDGETWLCRVRGRLKRGDRREQMVAVVGDRVAFRDLGRSGDEDSPRGIIEDVRPRRSRISRRSGRRTGGHTEQVLMANLDQVVAVQSVTEPDPQSGFVDRLLVSAERDKLPGVLCLNKVDRDPAAAADPRWDYYAGLGYEVLRTSAATGEGCEELARRLVDRLSLLLGASGVGKSSLLNRVEPGLGLRVTEVARTGLGRHTTTRTELFPLSAGGFIADSPGMRGFDLWDIDPASLADYFPDFREPAADCRFRTCLHRDEPGCGVKEAVARGAIPDWRHGAYLDLLSDVVKHAGGIPGRRV